MKLPGIRQCNFMFLLSLQHVTFRETDTQEMQKSGRFRKFNSVLNVHGYCGNINI